MEHTPESQNSEISQHPVPVPEKSGGFNWDKHFLPLAILIAGVLVSSSIIYVNAKDPGPSNAVIPGVNNGDRVEVSADDDAFMGSPDAPVTIIEFSDYQCPFCRVFWKDTLPLIKKNYIDTGKVKFVYRDYPLEFHPAAVPSALASECAQDQGKYWEYHDKIFAEQDKKGVNTVTYDASDLKKWAGQVGMDTKSFNDCLDSKKYKDEVEKDYQDGQAAGVSGTPGFYINGIAVKGALPYENFKTIIESELKNKK